MFLEWLPESIINPIRDGYFDQSEKRPALMCVVSNILLGAPVNPIPTSTYDTYKQRLMEDQGFNILSNHSYSNLFEYWGYMKDKHAGAVGDKKVLDAQFKILGAKVENEDQKAAWPILKEIYDLTPS